MEAATRFGHRFENLAVGRAAPIQRKPGPHDDEADHLPGAVPAAHPAVPPAALPAPLAAAIPAPIPAAPAVVGAAAPAALVGPPGGVAGGGGALPAAAGGPAAAAPLVGGGGALPAAAGGPAAPAPPGLPPLPPYAPPSGGTQAENFLAINSPGTQTGAIGGLAAANSLVSPPSGSGVAPTRYTDAASRITGPAGAGLNIAAGGADLLATYQGLRNMGQEGGIRGFRQGIGDTFSPEANETGAQAETRSTAKRLAVDATVNLSDAASQGMQAGNAISAATHAGTSMLPAATGIASAGIGAGVQTIVAGRAGYRAYRAHQHKAQIDAIRNDPAAGLSANMTAAATHMSDQLAKRRKRNILGGIGAGIGALGGGALLAGLLGAGAMFTPVGWALAGAGALAALGLGAYKLYRHYKKKNAPAGERLGEQRTLHARNLYQAASSPALAPHPDRANALRILASHGITPAQASDSNKGEQLIRRKLEGW